jgi:hypothetical protein
VGTLPCSFPLASKSPALVDTRSRLVTICDGPSWFATKFLQASLVFQLQMGGRSPLCNCP